MVLYFWQMELPLTEPYHLLMMSHRLVHLMMQQTWRLSYNWKAELLIDPSIRKKKSVLRQWCSDISTLILQTQRGKCLISSVTMTFKCQEVNFVHFDQLISTKRDFWILGTVITFYNFMHAVFTGWNGIIPRHEATKTSTQISQTEWILGNWLHG